MRIQHNIMAMSAYRNYTNNVSAMKKNLEKLSSGYKINRAGDDAAGLAISEKMRAQITGLETAQKNAKDGISLVQTAEGALTEVHDMLNRMVELATQSANGTYDNNTDRAQMEKELNQLRSEINRIADSSNFNGIKLLDGTAGMNTAAFDVNVAAAVKAAGGRADITQAWAASDAADPSLHLGVAGITSEKDPEFVIDLGTLTAKVEDAATQTIKFNIAGVEVSAQLTSKGGTAGNGVYSTSDIRDAIKTALAKHATAGVNASTGVSVTTGGTGMKIGDFVFEFSNAGTSGLKFTFKGVNTTTVAAGWKANGGTDTVKTFDTAQATAINNAIGKALTMEKTGASTKFTVEGKIYHNTSGVKYAQAITEATWAGIDFDLSKDDIVKQGNSLTIDGKKFVFQTEKLDAAKQKEFDDALGTAVKIDVSDVTGNEQFHKAADLLSQQTTTNGKFQIQSKGGSIIHLDQIQDATKSKPEDFNTYAKLTSDNVIMFEKATVSAKNIGTSIKGTASAIKSGDTLTVDGKKFIFTDDMTGKTDTTDTYYVDISGTTANNLKAKAMESLKTKLAGAFSGSTVEINDAKDTVTIRAAKSSAVSGPEVLGKGMTLQIGDTADDYNQLNVALKDCHTSSIGVAGISIANQEDASAAVDAIKNAINYVSDMRGTLGATQNRLDHTINNLSVMTENIQDAESTIRDTDVASEMMAYTKNNILIQSAQAMLAQANQVPQGVLQLLQ